MRGFNPSLCRALAVALAALATSLAIQARATETASWSELGAPNLGPPLYDHIAVFDPIGDRMIVIGGALNGVSQNAVWSMSLPEREWTELLPANTSVPLLQGHSAIYDPIRRRAVVFGGRRGTSATNEVWSLSLNGSATWSRLNPIGSGPGPRYNTSAVYDPVRDRMLVFGGSALFGSIPNYYYQVWALSLGDVSEWTLIDPGPLRPTGRTEHVAVYDPLFDRMVVHGGQAENPSGNGSIRLDETWELFLGGTPHWRFLTPSGPIPAARSGHASAIDPVSGRMFIHGGAGGSGGTSDSWTLSLSDTSVASWNSATAAPFPRWNHSIVLDESRHRFVVYGGLLAARSREEWAFSLDDHTWTDLGVPGPAPPVRAGHYAVFDPVSAQMYVILGQLYGTGGNVPDVWAWSAITNQWTSVMASTPITGRHEMAVAWDPGRRTAFFFGGTNFSGSGIFDELWSLELGGIPTWTKVATLGAPPAKRYEAAMAHDPVRDRLVLFGGRSNFGAGTEVGDAWELNLGTRTWTPLVTQGPGPGVRAESFLVCDAPRDRMLLLGGSDSTGSHHDAWALSPDGAWLQVSADGPALRSCVLDPAHDRIIAVSGGNGSLEALEFDLETHTWTEAPSEGSGPFDRSGSSLVLDPTNERFMVFGGFSGNNNFNDTWFLQVSSTDVLATSPGGIPMSGSLSFGLSRPTPNPSRGPIQLNITLTDVSPALLTAHDLSGRRVFEKVLHSLQPGTHTETVGPTDLWRPGIYWFRLTQGARVSTARAVVLR